MVAKFGVKNNRLKLKWPEKKAARKLCIINYGSVSNFFLQRNVHIYTVMIYTYPFLKAHMVLEPILVDV